MEQITLGKFLLTPADPDDDDSAPGRKYMGSSAWSVQSLAKDLDGCQDIIEALDEAAVRLANIPKPPGSYAELVELREQVKHLERKEAERAKYMERLVADAHEYADDNNLCEKFDEFMEEHGLARRSHTYRVRVSREVTITEYTYVTITANDEDEAYDLAQRDAENNHTAHSWNEGYDSRELDNYAADDIEEV